MGNQKRKLGRNIMNKLAITPIGDDTVALTKSSHGTLGDKKSNHCHMNRRADSDVAHDLMRTLGFASRDRPIREYLALTCLLFNFANCIATGEQDSPAPLIVPCKKERYVGTGLGYSAMIDVIMALEAEGLAKKTTGNWKAGKASELLPTPRLVEMLASQTNVHVEDVQVPELVVLKDSDGKRLPLPDTDAVRKMRKNLETINASSAQFTWRFTHEGTEWQLLPSDLACHRTFNHGSFELGGRFYSQAEGLPERKMHLRSTLTVDGRPTVELDHKSMQPRMLYHIEGLVAPEDCYDITVPGLEDVTNARDIIKKAVLIALNCKEEQRPANALALALREDNLRLPKKMTPTALLASVKAAHPQIAHYFCSGIGLSLQFRDAQIAERVLLAFAEAKKPCLPIHDSFVVAADDEDFAMVAMNEAYYMEMGAMPEIAKKEAA